MSENTEKIRKALEMLPYSGDDPVAERIEQEAREALAELEADEEEA